MNSSDLGTIRCKQPTQVFFFFRLLYQKKNVCGLSKVTEFTIKSLALGIFMFSYLTPSKPDIIEVIQRVILIHSPHMLQSELDLLPLGCMLYIIHYHSVNNF